MPSPTATARDRQFHEDDDQRARTERDRDRVLYSSAFSRLNGVTQVVASDEGHPFHNRLTHSLKVAQIARRIAERLFVEQPFESLEAHVDPGACEAAALAHDLGHPPFGHIAEKCLDDLVREESNGGVVAGDPDGFEGNEQSFRIVVQLSQRRNDFDGLNLTRASLDAILKYPWLRSGPNERATFAKFGAYRSEESTFNWVRELHPAGNRHPCANAAIMNWSDDVAYAVHDVEDFFRAGLVPLDRLYWDRTEREAFLAWLRERWAFQLRHEGKAPPYSLDDWDRAENEVHQIFQETPLNRFTKPYTGEASQRKALRGATALLIARYLNAVHLESHNGRWSLAFSEENRAYREVEIMKELVWCYVIDKPELRTQQYGQQRIVKDLFRTYKDAVAREDLAVLPPNMRGAVMAGLPPERAAADAVSSLTERQAVLLWRKLTGIAQIPSLTTPLGEGTQRQPSHLCLNIRPGRDP